MWVVRDFALQLLDTDGEVITSREYLEQALEEQKGITEQIMEKNRIRKLLKCFFKDRDCCTMIRPLTDESKLQDLQSMDLDDLRPEFMKQVLELRSKILQRMKFKMINGRKLTGPMLAHLSETYVNAINEGAVPNIENAWTYICQTECQKALEGAFSIFEQSFQTLLPCDELTLKNDYTSAREEALYEFSKRSVGQVTEDFLKEL
jgi:hypothetical protein